jgi:dTDP-glucose 4,6-dehydratase
MTISEAVHLVLKSAVIGKNAETLILDMGKPMKIDLIARRMISASGQDIEITYTGLNPGEKLNEVLFNSDEKIEKSENDYIMRTKVNPVSVGGN